MLVSQWCIYIILKHQAYSWAVFRLSAHTHMHCLNNNDKQKPDLLNKAYSRNNESAWCLLFDAVEVDWSIILTNYLVTFGPNPTLLWSFSLYCIEIFSVARAVVGSERSSFSPWCDRLRGSPSGARRRLGRTDQTRAPWSPRRKETGPAGSQCVHRGPSTTEPHWGGPGLWSAGMLWGEGERISS